MEKRAPAAEKVAGAFLQPPQAEVAVAKRKAGKQHRKVKAKVAKKHVARKHVAKKQVRSAPQRKPKSQVAPPAPSAPAADQQSQPQAPQASGSHLDAPSAVAHPGAGHRSVVRSEVQR